MSSPSKNKANFKSYDGMVRLLAAVIGTNNNIKLDFVELARYIGGGATKDAVNHRLRPIKQLAKMQASCVKGGQDPGDLPADKGALAELVGGGVTGSALEHRMRHIKQLAKLQVDYRDKGKDPGELPFEKGEIQKLFGESTPSGIEWQFRDIKNLSKAQKQAVNNGENPAVLPVPGTPSAGRGKGAGARATKTPGTATPGTGGRKRKAPTTLPPVDSSDDSDCNIVDTPSKRPEKKRMSAGPTTLSKQRERSATLLAADHANIASSAPGKTTIADTIKPITTPNLSIFGGDGSTPAIMPFNEDGTQMSSTRGTRLFASATKPTTKPVDIKMEFATHMGSFANSMDAGGFENGDEFEDGEA